MQGTGEGEEVKKMFSPVAIAEDESGREREAVLRRAGRWSRGLFNHHVPK